MRILVAEDQPDNQEIIRRRLTRRGHEVQVADNGRIAIEVALEWMPDLILMDVSMPEISGLDATTHLRSLPAFTSVPIIAVTAHAMASDRQRCLAAGCTDFVSKPIEFKNLFAMSERYSATTAVQPVGATT